MIPLSFQGSHFLYYYFLPPPPPPSPLSLLLPPKTLSPFTSSHSSYFFNFEHPSPYNIPCTLSSLLIPRTISLLKHACFSSHLPISFLSHPFSLSSYYPQLSSPETSFHPLPWVSLPSSWWDYFPRLWKIFRISSRWWRRVDRWKGREEAFSGDRLFPADLQCGALGHGSGWHLERSRTRGGKGFEWPPVATDRPKGGHHRGRQWPIDEWTRLWHSFSHHCSDRGGEIMGGGLNFSILWFFFLIVDCRCEAIFSKKMFCSFSSRNFIPIEASVK